jgi:hypothetical protein
MALLIETGAGVAGANSYGVAGAGATTNAAATLAAARAYALDRGVILSADDAVVTAQLIHGTDYIESYARQFVGSPASVTQGLSWPRVSVLQSDSSIFPSNELPQPLLNALYQLCIDQNAGTVLMPTTDPAVDGGFVIEEAVGPISTKYSERIGTTKQPVLRAFDAIISALLYTSSLIGVRTLRV